MSMAPLVVISHYAARPLRSLRRLLRSLNEVDAGAPFDVLVVANVDEGHAFERPSWLAQTAVLTHPNMGMNIGAWEHGRRSEPLREMFVFLQDECVIQRAGWLAAYLEKLSSPGIGLVGEALNPAWCKPWPELARERAGEFMVGHDIAGEPMPRVAFYLDFFARNGIDPGATGRHLRSLVWAARAEVLERIGGFPTGRSYGECIGAEIGVSRRIESAGLRVEQVSAQPFHFIRHADWTRIRPDGPFVHEKSLPGWRRFWRRVSR